MPARKKPSRYNHFTQRKASRFIKSSMFSMCAKAAKKRGYYRGKRFDQKHIIAIVGKLKFNGEWTVQKFLEPKDNNT